MPLLVVRQQLHGAVQVIADRAWATKLTWLSTVK